MYPSVQGWHVGSLLNVCFGSTIKISKRLSSLSAVSLFHTDWKSYNVFTLLARLMFLFLCHSVKVFLFSKLSSRCQLFANCFEAIKLLVFLSKIFTIFKIYYPFCLNRNDCLKESVLCCQFTLFRVQPKFFPYIYACVRFFPQFLLKFEPIIYYRTAENILQIIIRAHRVQNESFSKVWPHTPVSCFPLNE